jgi:organic radical activating enzyme
MNKWIPTSNTQCILKWSWNTLYFYENIYSRSCCRVEKQLVDKDDFANFHNINKWVSDRQLMLDGKWPDDCDVCRIPESQGLISQRIIHNEMQHIVPDSIKQDPSSIKAFPNTLELVFRNTCNMACIYCDSKYSSRWQRENEQFGTIAGIKESEIPKANKDYDPEKITSVLWPWLAENGSSLNEISILGGEPFLIPETQKLVDFLEENPLRRLHLSLISNLNVPEKVFDATINRLNNLIVNKKLFRVKITASIDGFDKTQEFQRYGLDLELFEKNMLQLLKTPTINVGINFAATCLGIHSMPALIEKIAEWQKIKKIDFSGSLVITHDSGKKFLEIETLPRKYLQPALDRIMHTIENHGLYELESRLEIIKHTIENVCGEGNIQQMQNLKNYLDVLSLRRNTDWKQYYPWLVEIFDEHLVH